MLSLDNKSLKVLILDFAVLYLRKFWNLENEKVYLLRLWYPKSSKPWRRDVVFSYLRYRKLQRPIRSQPTITSKSKSTMCERWREQLTDPSKIVSNYLTYNHILPPFQTIRRVGREHKCWEVLMEKREIKKGDPCNKNLNNQINSITTNLKLPEKTNGATNLGWRKH